MSVPETACAALVIDLDAVAANWRLLGDRLRGARCAAVVKADAYGLGAARVAPVLAEAGCETFFVAHIDEALALREALPEAEIHVLNGFLPGTGTLFAFNRLVPVLNSLKDIADWVGFRKDAGRSLPADVHVDTGMSRLGLPPDEVATLAARMDLLEALDVRYWMSHLACADAPDHPMNAEQRDAFKAFLRGVPKAPAAFANSSGILLGADFHFDLARPGIALYGGNPRPGAPNPMAPVVRLEARILQVREVDAPRTVGYGASHRFAGPTRVATVGVGYADGYLRSLGNRGCGYIGDVPVPIVGRVSMDLTTLDVSAVPEPLARPGAVVDMIGPHNPVDAVAEAAGTISYEILTGLGRRYHRTYLHSKQAAR